MEDINQPVTPPQASEQLHSDLENSSKSKMIPFIIVAVLLILVGVGSYILGTKKTQTVIENKVIIQPSPTPTPDPTASWQTFANTQYGYTLRHPLDWKYAVSPKGLGQVILLPQNEQIPLEPSFIVVSVANSIIEPLIEGDERNILVNKKSVTVAGLNGEQGGFKEYGTEGISHIQTAVAHNNQTYYFYLDRLEYVDIYNQILSTFRFTDQSTPEKVTKDFYSAYITCIESSDPSKDCDYRKSKFVSAELEQYLKGTYNSIMCAQNTPKSVTVDKSNIAGNTATVIAHHMYESSGDNPITVTLRLIDNQWKIINITCQAR